MNLPLFFQEKEIPFEVWSIEAGDTAHIIDTDFVKELILQAPASEKQQIEKILVQLDFANAPIAPFLKFLAEQYVTNGAGAR